MPLRPAKFISMAVWSLPKNEGKNFFRPAQSPNAPLFTIVFPFHTNNKEYGTLHDLIDALDRNDIDMVMQSESWLRALTNYSERPGFKANIIFDSPYTSSFGFNKNETLLCSIVDKALNTINTA
jgi:ABC-type amino acid transport substrate-binding protein